MGNTVNNLPYPDGDDFVADGDNAIRALAEALKIASGKATVGPAVSGAVYADKAITFPVGLFSTPPIVLVCGTNNTSGTGILIQPVTSSITAAGCTLRAVTSTGSTFTTGYTAQWIAIAVA